MMVFKRILLDYVRVFACILLAILLGTLIFTNKVIIYDKIGIFFLAIMASILILLYNIFIKGFITTKLYGYLIKTQINHGNMPHQNIVRKTFLILICLNLSEMLIVCFITLLSAKLFTSYLIISKIYIGLLIGLMYWIIRLAINIITEKVSIKFVKDRNSEEE